MKVILDCDNTFGIPDHDVDDGLALLYLLGREGVDLLGVTCTFGNADAETVFRNTGRFLREIGRPELPLLRGGTREEPVSPAARFLADTVAARPGEVTVLATGALTNLYGAGLCGPSFFRDVARVVVMGGLTSPLVLGGRQMDELNLSSDPRAAHAVLFSPARTTVITGNLCLQALFGHAEFGRLEEGRDHPVFGYLLQALRPWRRLMEEVFGVAGFYNWDTAAAVYATDPALFLDRACRLASTPADLETGLLRAADSGPPDGPTVNIPSAIREAGAFHRHVLAAWQRLRLP
jgi:inosine-uridine nucleoside N-ribohydrolase